MAADRSLSELTKAIYLIADKTKENIQPDVKDIRDAICGPAGILESMFDINKTMEKLEKQKTIDKLTGANKYGKEVSSEHNRKLLKSSDTIVDVLKKILTRVEKIESKAGRLGGSGSKSDSRRLEKSDRDEKNKRLGGILKSIEIIERLRNVKLKDFLFAKTKLKHISKIMSRALNMFKMFKNQKEMDNTVSFVFSSIEIMEKLAKMSPKARRAKKGEKAISHVFFGKSGRGGLLELFRRVSKNAPIIKLGKKLMKDLAKATGSMLLVTMALTGIAVFSIPAMLGALLMKGVIAILLPSFRLLTKSRRIIHKGSAALLAMSVSIIAFGLGLALMAKAVRDIKLKDIGLMIASILGISLAVWVVGKLAAGVIKGSIVLTALGAGLIVYGLGLGVLKKGARGLTLKDVGVIVASLLGTGLAVAGIGLLAVPILIGSATLLVLGLSLGLFALTLLIWKKIDVKSAMGNIELAVNGLRDIFGLKLGKDNDEKASFGEKLKSGILGFAMALLEGGKSFFIMGTILLAGAALGVLFLGLKAWEKFSGAKKAIANVKEAVTGLKDVFGLNEKQPEGALGIKSLGKGIFDLAMALLSGGKALVEMATIAVAVLLSDLIRVGLIPWNNYDARGAIGNLRIAIEGLKDLFGLNEHKDEGFFGNVGSIVGETIKLALAILQMGKVFIEMGTIMLAVAMSDLIRVGLIPWNNYDASKAIGNLGIAISGLKNLFGLNNDDKSGIEKIGSLAGELINIALGLLQMGRVFIEMATLVMATAMSDIIRLTLIPWNSYDAKGAIGNMRIAITGLKDLFGINNDNKSPIEKVGSLFGAIFEIALALLQMGKVFIEMATLAIATGLAEKIRENLEPWNSYNASQAINNLGIAVTGLKQLFGLESEKGKTDVGKGLFGGLMEIGSALLKSGKTLIEMGTLAIATELAFKIRLYLSVWNNFDPTKATKNLRTAINTLKDIFGLNEKMDSDKGFFGSFLGGMCNIGMSLMNGRKELIKMGTIAVATGIAEKIQEHLVPWDTFDPRDAVAHLRDAVETLEDVFGLNESEYDDINLKTLGGSILDIGLTLLNSGKVLVKMGVISIATGMLKNIKENLEPWEDYKVDDGAIGNIKNAIGKLEEVFGFDDMKNISDRPDLSKQDLIGDLVSIAGALFKGGKLLVKLGVITLATGLLSKIRGNIEGWKDFEPGNALDNVQTAVDRLLDIFGFEGIEKKSEQNEKSTLEKIGDFFGNAFSTIANVVTLPFQAMSGISSLIDMGGRFAKVGAISLFTKMLNPIKEQLTEWTSFQPDQGLDNISTAVTGLFDVMKKASEVEIRGTFLSTTSQIFKYASGNIKDGLINISDGLKKSDIIKEAVPPLEQTVNAVNSLDITKASTMIEMFKSFTNIGIRPFDKFTEAVHQFSDSCDNLIEALENFEFSSNEEYIPSENGEGQPEGSSTSNKPVVSSSRNQELAEAIAKAIKALPVHVTTNISDIRLVAEGVAGREVRLRLIN